MSEPSNPQPSGARPKWPVSVDAVIALGVALLTCHVVWTTPQFAASLPQDAADYAIPAVNLLERGRLVVSAYGLDFPPVHPPGMPLLLVPAYMLTGHFLGNGIYAILFCSAAMVALTYWIGVKLGGRYCGCAAALFLIWNYSFWEYSHKIMSEVPSALLGVLVLGLLLAIGDSKRPGMICLAVGAIIGFAVTVRNDSLLLLAAAIPLLAWKSATRERARRLGLVLVGTAPFVIGQAVYNRSAYGSPWRTGYHYWGSAGSTNRPLFSAGYITRTGFMRLEGITNDDPLAEGNATLYLKSLLDQADASDIFINYPRGRSSTVRFHRAMTLVRTGLGVLGLVACVTTWRTNPLRRKFFVWAILITVACFGFFLLYYYRDQRFLARLVPVFCLADGIGVAALLVKWPSPAARVVVVVFVAALIRWYMIATLGMGLPKGEPQRIYEGLTGVARPNRIQCSHCHKFWSPAV